jgi:tripartite-type tricarboxylate transporter receptor subunit TctC
MKLPSLTACVALVLALTGASPALSAEPYPTRPIRFVVGFAAGGATDLLARIAAQKLSERLGQQVVVENRPGAGGTVATTAVAQSPADGYTFLVVSASHAINASLYRSLPYDTTADFVGVGTIATAPNVLVVHPSVPVNSLAEFIAYVKARPNTLNIASAGVGSSSHLAGELFKNMAGIQLVHVPYKGTAEAVRDLITGQVQSSVDAVSALLPYIDSGALKALGVGDPKPIAKLPKVPAITEAGVPGYSVFAWVGVVAPAKTPREMIQKMSDELAATMRSPDVEKKVDELGARAFINTPESFDALIGSEITKFADVIRTAGVKVE